MPHPDFATAPTSRRVKILQDEKADILNQMQAMLDEADGVGFSGEQEGKYRSLEGKLKEKEFDIGREQRQLEIERGQSDLSFRKELSDPSNAVFQTTDGRMVESLDAKDSAFEMAFPESELNEHPYIAGQAIAAMLGGSPINMAVIGGTDSAGGYLLNPEVSTLMVDLARSASVVMRAGARTIPMSTAELTIARQLADPVHQWRAEGVEVTGSSLTFDKVTLRPKTVSAIVPVSLEWAEDVANGPQMIQNAMRNALGLALDQACLLGTGAESEPLGIVNTENVNTVTGVGTPADYSDLTTAVREILEANYPGEVSDLTQIAHPRDFATYDDLADTTGQPLQPTPWAAALRKLHTTSLPTTLGGGSNESQMVVGHFPQLVVGMRTNGVRIQILDAGSITNEDGETVNAASQLMLLIRAYMRVDCAILRPAWFNVLSGVTNT